MNEDKKELIEYLMETTNELYDNQAYDFEEHKQFGQFEVRLSLYNDDLDIEISHPTEDVNEMFQSEDLYHNHKFSTQDISGGCIDGYSSDIIFSAMRV